MILYPYNAAIILTDDIFQAYGGDLSKGTPAQRSASYLIAEKQMTSHLSAFLLPTKVTGTFGFTGPTHLALPYAFVSSVDSVKLIHQEDCYDCDTTEYTGCAFVWEDTFAYIDVRQVENACGCCCSCMDDPYQTKVVWTSGLPSGTTYQADMLLALTMAADITLNEIIDPGANEGTGDIGIQEFSNQQYNEKRVKLMRTSFGSSARAQKVAQLVSNLRRKRALKF